MKASIAVLTIVLVAGCADELGPPLSFEISSHRVLTENAGSFEESLGPLEDRSVILHFVSVSYGTGIPQVNTLRYTSEARGPAFDYDLSIEFVTTSSGVYEVGFNPTMLEPDTGEAIDARVVLDFFEDTTNQNEVRTTRSVIDGVAPTGANEIANLRIDGDNNQIRWDQLELIGRRGTSNVHDVIVLSAGDGEFDPDAEPQ